MIEFTVRGLPVAQGSKRHVGKGRMVESNHQILAPWRLAVGHTAAAAMNDTGILTGPVSVVCSFYFPRPKSHYGTGRNSEVRKPHAPTYPAGKPDLDKLVRAILDAITGIVVRDDSQVVALNARKLYDSHPRVFCEVRTL